MVRVKQNFPVEVDEEAGCCSTASPSVAVSVKKTAEAPKKANQPKLPKCSFPCDQTSEAISSIGSRKLTDYLDQQLGTCLSSIWKFPSQYYHFCRSHYRRFLEIRAEWESKHNPKKRRRESEDFDETETMDAEKAAEESTTVSHDVCQICGCTFAGVYKTVDREELAQDIDKILGCHISENWMESANICFKHLYEYQVKKDRLSKPKQHQCFMCEHPTQLAILPISTLSTKEKLCKHFDTNCTGDDTTLYVCTVHWKEYLEEEKKETRKRAGESVKLQMGHPLLTAANVAEMEPPVAREWKRMKFAPVTVESWVKEKSNSTESRPCCVCGVSTNLQEGVRISDPDVKQKLNERFGTKHAANGEVLFVCGIDWADYLNMESTNQNKIADSLSINHLFSGISTNEQEFKEEVVEEFGDFVEEHQSFDTKETTDNQLMKDEVINVEQLIGQGQKVQQRKDRESIIQYTVDGSEYVNRLNPGIPVKEEIKDELD